jgi:hypothetical protein
MDIGLILIGAALVILVAFLVGQPLLDNRTRREPEPGEADRLRQERDQLLVALRDLDFDYSLGKLIEEDYTPLRADLVRQGAEVMKQLDAVGQAPQSPQPPGAARPPAAASDSDIEQAIAARRQSRPKETRAACPRCGAPTQPADDFCPRCGAALRLTCPKCGTAAQAGDQFCAKCGTKLPSPPAEVSA